MLALLTAVAICLLIPYLHILILRRLPRAAGASRRLEPPLSPAGIDLLAESFQPQLPQLQSEAGILKAGPGGKEEVVEPKEKALSGSMFSGQAEEDRSPFAGATRTTTKISMTTSDIALPSYQWFPYLRIPVLFLVMPGGLFGLTYLLAFMAEEHARSFPASVFLIKPDYQTICGGPACFLAMLTLSIVNELFWQLSLGRRSFIEFLFGKEGARGKVPYRLEIKVGIYFSLFVMAAGPIFLWLTMSWYARFTEEEIAIHRFLSFGEEHHPYTDVKQLIVSSYRKHGEDLVLKTDLRICFSNGQTWETYSPFPLPQDARERERLLAFLCRKTGLPLTRRRLLNDTEETSLKGPWTGSRFASSERGQGCERRDGG